MTIETTKENPGIAKRIEACLRVIQSIDYKLQQNNAAQELVLTGNATMNVNIYIRDEQNGMNSQYQEIPQTESEALLNILKNIYNSLDKERKAAVKALQEHAVELERNY